MDEARSSEARTRLNGGCVVVTNIRCVDVAVEHLNGLIMNS